MATPLGYTGSGSLDLTHCSGECVRPENQIEGAGCNSLLMPANGDGAHFLLEGCYIVRY